MDENRVKMMTASAVVRRCRSALTALKDASNSKNEEDGVTTKDVVVAAEEKQKDTIPLSTIADLDASTEEEDESPMPRPTIGEELEEEAKNIGGVPPPSPMVTPTALVSKMITPVKDSAGDKMETPKRTNKTKNSVENGVIYSPTSKSEETKSTDFLASPITQLEGDYSSLEDNKTFLTQEQVDIMMKKTRIEIERSFAVKMALMEDQLKEALEESKKMEKEREETAMIVFEFEKTCEEIKERCNEQLQQQLAMFTEMSAKTKSELESARSARSEAEKRGKSLEIELDTVRAAFAKTTSENANLAEKAAKHSVALAANNQQIKTMEKHRQKCDERYKEHMESAQNHCKKEKRKRAEAEAAVRTMKAELDVAKSTTSKYLQKLERAKRDLEMSRESSKKTEAMVSSLRKDLSNAKAAEEAARDEFRRHKEAEPDHSELYKELTKALLDLKKEKKRTETLEKEKAEVFGMCEDLMQQIEAMKSGSS